MLKNLCVVFDLDDTLYNEIDFIKSGYSHIKNYLNNIYNLNIRYIPNDIEIKTNKKHIQKFIKKNNLNYIKADIILNILRYHTPNISLHKKTSKLLNDLKKLDVKLGIITDGRSLTQRNKIYCLKILNIIDVIYISEEIKSLKPNSKAFKKIENKFKGHKYIYIGDNPYKDFATPNKLGWLTIGILNKQSRIHTIKKRNQEYFKPHTQVNQIEDLSKSAIKKLVYNFYN
jgi:putative hydrolase of the HAD superfamily